MMRKAHLFALALLAVAASGCIRYADISKQMTRHKLRALEKRFEHFNGTYKLGIPDSINISIPDHPDLSGLYELRSDGNISFPLLGDVYVEGLTPMQLSESLAKRLEQFVRRVEILVTVSGPRSQQFYIFSRSRNGGRAFTFTGDISVLDALAQHGGWVRTYDFSSRIRLIRDNPKEPEIYRIRADQFVRGDLSTNILVKENDMVYIPGTWIAEITYFVEGLTAPLRSIVQGARDIGETPYAIETERYRARRERYWERRAEED